MNHQPGRQDGVESDNLSRPDMPNDDSTSQTQLADIYDNKLKKISDSLLHLHAAVEAQRMESKENKSFVAFSVSVCLVLMMCSIIAITLIVLYGKGADLF